MEGNRLDSVSLCPAHFVGVANRATRICNTEKPFPRPIVGIGRFLPKEVSYISNSALIIVGKGNHTPIGVG